MSHPAPPSTVTRAPAAPERAPIPIEQLVQEVYACAPPQAQEHMLAQLVGKIYEVAPAPLQTRLLEQLLRPVGVLSLMAIANGIYHVSANGFPPL